MASKSPSLRGRASRGRASAAVEVVSGLTSRPVRMRPTALMRSSVGVEHPTAHPRAGGCTAPLANVRYGLGVERLIGRLASKVAAATRAQAGVSGPRNGILVMAH